MATNQKDTVYIDIDDEITSIIDKVRAADARIVALVLPKRAAVLQSIVNMKLLKKTAEQAKKHVVLITSESGLLPLAGAVGLHVASSLQSKPAIPVAGGVVAAEVIDGSGDFDAASVADRPVGQLAGPAASAYDANDLDTITLDDEPAAADAAKAGTVTGLAAGAAPVSAAGASTKADKAAKGKKDSKLKIPDFNKFRLWLIAGGALLIALIVFGYFALVVMPKATVTIATDSSDIPTNADITLDPSADELDLEDRVLPAKIETKQQASTQQATATGQKNNGTKATGEVRMTAGSCSADIPEDVPAGTGVSSNGMTFITGNNTTFVPTSSNGKCVFTASRDTNITAQKAGATYNIAATTFSVAGRSEVKANSEDPTSGGTDNIVKVVAQSDIDNAKQKLTASTSSSVKSELQSKLTDDGYKAVASSLKAGDAAVTSSVNVGDQADVVTVTSTTTYTMYGIKTSDLKRLILDNVKDKIDSSKQQILNDGTDKAAFTINSPASSGELQVRLAATSLAGPDLKTDTLKSQIAGKKTNDVRTAVTSTPGVTGVTVKYSPFWVSKVPKNQDKITIVIEKASASKNN